MMIKWALLYSAWSFLFLVLLKEEVACFASTVKPARVPVGILAVGRTVHAVAMFSRFAADLYDRIAADSVVQKWNF